MPHTFLFQALFLDLYKEGEVESVHKRGVNACRSIYPDLEQEDVTQALAYVAWLAHEAVYPV